MNKMPTSQKYCFTWNNPPLDDWNNPNALLERIKALPKITSRASNRHARIRYIVFQRELACTTNTPHFQGYFEVSCRISMNQMKADWASVWGFGQHFEEAKGDKEKNREYCTKIRCGKPGHEPEHFTAYIPPNEVHQIFEWTNENESQVSITPQQQAVIEVIDLIKEGAGFMDCVLHQGGRLANTVSMRMPFFDRVRSGFVKRPAHIRPYVVVATGEPGLGKTEFCRRFLQVCGRRVWNPQAEKLGYDLSEIYETTALKGWFPGYDGQQAVILSEYRGQLMTSHLLALLDKGGDVTVEIKGSNVPFNGMAICVNSNYSMMDFYNSETNQHWRLTDFPALARRVCEYWHFTISPHGLQAWTEETECDHERKWRYAQIHQMRFDHEAKLYVPHRIWAPLGRYEDDTYIEGFWDKFLMP